MVRSWANRTKPLSNTPARINQPSVPPTVLSGLSEPRKRIRSRPLNTPRIFRPWRCIKSFMALLLGKET